MEPVVGRARWIRRGVLAGGLSVFFGISLAGSALAGETDARPGSRAAVAIFVTRGDPGGACNRVVRLRRSVAAPAVLAGALRKLLEGPTAAERRRGYGGWFSRRTAGLLRSVRIEDGVAYVDFADFSRIIPGASSSCGSSILLAQLDRTATQFRSVRRAVYSFDGSRRAFYEWLQRSPEAP